MKKRSGELVDAPVTTLPSASLSFSPTALQRPRITGNPGYISTPSLQERSRGGQTHYKSTLFQCDPAALLFIISSILSPPPFLPSLPCCARRQQAVAPKQSKSNHINPNQYIPPQWDSSRGDFLSFTRFSYLHRWR